MRWTIKHCNILDEPAGVLICSANVHLTLSGGVGADLLARYGTTIARALDNIIQKRSPHHLARGEVVPYRGPEIPYEAILHAVAVDGWYDSTPEIITGIVKKSLQMAADWGARKVALTALATGFGHLTLAEFAQGIRPLLKIQTSPIEEVVICLLIETDAKELARNLPDLKYSKAEGTI